MFRTARALRATLEPARRWLALLVPVAALCVPTGAAAGPLKATSFVRGTAVAEGAYPGAIRAFAGDLDGDGKDDLVFGNTLDAWVLYGTSPSADADLGLELGARGWRVAGLSTGVYDVAGAGDFDGDGLDDLLVGTDFEAYVIYGSRTRRTGALTLSPGAATQPAGVTRITTSTSAQGSTTGIGDFNGDGYDDVAVQRGYPGTSIVLGGPRVATISGTARGTRTSLVNATQRCAWVWLSYRCVSLGVNVDAVGDFDGDGKDDLVIESSAADGNFILYGRTGTFAIQAVAQSGTTRLPNGQTGDISGIVGNYHGAGDVNGDGRGEVVAWGTVLVHGRAGRPSSISRSSSLVALRPGSLRDVVVEGVGDQDGDGRGDLAVYGSGAGSPVRIVTSVPAAPGSVDLSTGTPVAGLPAEVGMGLEGGGDLDGDGLGDLLVPTGYPQDSTYLLTHGTGSPGGVERPARLDGQIRLLDAGGAVIDDYSGTLRATCAGRAGAPADFPTYGGGSTLGDYLEGDSCTVAASIRLGQPAAYAKCTWTETATLDYDQPVAPGAAFTLVAGKNHWELERRCVLPSDEPPLSFEAPGWTFSGSAYLNSYRVELNDLGTNQTGSAMWSGAADYRNRTIEFVARIAGGTGAAEGMTVAFVRPDASGQPTGGRLGAGGGQLGFGGLGGVAVAFDTKRDAGDPSANFVGFTDGPDGAGGLRWLSTFKFTTQLRNPAGINVKIASKAGRTTVTIDGRVRLDTTLAIPPSAFLAFTGATGSVYQLHSLWNLKITPS